uniref:PH domain-containing protein n=1 Tax=Hyaloperonospora arabidopsidis (strain Emoy2) TaxID=559515 RepID=M4B2U2_HYAAE
MNHRMNSLQSGRRGRSGLGLSIPGLNVDIEMLVQSTQGSAMHFGRKSSNEKFHGWLWKKSGRFSKWRNQHFVLDGALLTYYDTFPTDQFVSESSLMPIQGDNLFTTKSESTPAGAVRVAHVETSPKSKIAFKVYAVSGKIIDVRAKNDTLCRQWVDRLNEAAALAKRQESLNNSTTSTASSTISMGYSDSELEMQCNIVDKSGWLEVGDRKSKRARFCVMQGNMFTVYDTEDAWAVPLSRAYVTHAEKISEATCEFSVSTSAGKISKTLICKARSQDEMHMWMEALSSAFA